jgi:hypothetical protein
VEVSMKESNEMKRTIRGHLYEEAMGLLTESRILKETVYWQHELAEELSNKYGEDEFEGLGGEGRSI